MMRAATGTSRRRIVFAAALVAGLCVVVLTIKACTGSPRAAGPAAKARIPARPKPHGRPITVAWGGDVTLGSSFGLPPDQGRPELAAVASALRHADLATVNYEGTFGVGGASKCASTVPGNCFAFQAPPANARTLHAAGVDVVNQANNHAWDFGPLGFHATRAALAAAKVRSTGAPGEIALRTRRGTRIAIAGFSTYPWSNSMSNPDDVRSLVGLAAGEADVVIVFMHAGAEGENQVHVPLGGESAFGEDRGDSRTFAHSAIDAGADLVLGSGPHVLRGVELYKGRLIAYSLGNLAGWHNFSVHGATALSALLTVHLAADGRFRSANLRSLRLDSAGVPHPDPTDAAAKLVRDLTRSDFAGGGLRIGSHGSIAAVKHL